LQADLDCIVLNGGKPNVHILPIATASGFDMYPHLGDGTEQVRVGLPLQGQAFLLSLPQVLALFSSCAKAAG
jgi:hypothetical protein